MLSSLTDPLLTLLYPQYCGACGLLIEKQSYGAACHDCWNSTRIFGELDALCVKCGLLLIGISNQAHSTCGQCDEHHYDAAGAAGLYEKAVVASVLHLKHTPNVAAAVRDRLTAAFELMETPVGITVIPVPLSKRRSLERGFNQASLLARIISKHAGLPLDEHSLVRERDTPVHRAAMDRKAREATVRNAFTVARPNLVNGKNILLVDDLMTSGSTVSHCAKALKKSGAEKVIVLTLARAV